MRPGMRPDSADARIFTIPKLGEKLKADSTPLTYTPRKFISHPYSPLFYVIEADHRVYGPKTIQRLAPNVDLGEYSRIRAPAGRWASLIRTLDPIAVSSISMLAFGLAILSRTYRLARAHSRTRPSLPLISTKTKQHSLLQSPISPKGMANRT